MKEVTILLNSDYRVKGKIEVPRDVRKLKRSVDRTS